MEVDIGQRLKENYKEEERILLERRDLLKDLVQRRDKELQRQMLKRMLG